MKVKNNYDECLTNLACSIKKYFNLDYKHKTIDYIDKLLNENIPVLEENMIPIIYENEKWVIADRNTIYWDYANKIWANAVITKKNQDINDPNSKSREYYLSKDAIGEEINENDIILADEPTGALDSKSAKMLLERLEYLNKEKKSTILMVTHDAYTASYSSRVIFIKDGRIFNEIEKGNLDRKEFFDKIIDVVTILGGDLSDR